MLYGTDAEIERELAGNSVDPRFYLAAFGKGYEKIWKASGKAGNIPTQSFHYLLNIFDSESEIAYRHRGDALYFLVNNVFSSDDPKDVLNTQRRLLPANNWVSKALDSICIAYNDFPSRVFKEENSGVDQYMRRLYDRNLVDVELREIYRAATLNNFVLARPFFVKGKETRLKFQTLDLSNCVPVFDGDGELSEVWIPSGEVEKEDPKKYRFKVWTKDKIYFVNYEGKNITTIDNTQREIPFVPLILKRSKVGAAEDGGLFSLVTANLIDNLLHWTGLNSALFNSFSVWIATNLKWTSNKSAKLFPAKVISVDGAQMANDLQPILPPSLDSIASDGQYITIGDYRANIKEERLLDIGLPDFLANRRANVPTTATEQILKYSSLAERRKFDLPTLFDFERRLAGMIARLAAMEIGIPGLPETFEDFKIDFPELRIVQTPEGEIKYDATLVLSGLQSLPSFVRKYSGKDDIISDDEAKKYLAEKSASLGFAQDTPVAKMLEVILTQNLTTLETGVRNAE